MFVSADIERAAAIERAVPCRAEEGVADRAAA